jgi:hypothetical protein
MKQLFTILLLSFTAVVFAQDRLILKNQSEYQVNIISILQQDILFKAWQSSDTTTYSISKAEVASIVYRNGQKVTITTENATPLNATPKYQQPSVGSPQGSYVPMPNYNQPQTTAEASSNYDFEHTFVPISKEFKSMSRSQKKAITKDRQEYSKYRGDGALMIGVNVMTFGQTTIPTFMFYTDRVVARNIAITFGIGVNYNSEKSGEYRFTTLTENFIIGSSYYFNELLKLKKEKASLYAGIFLSPILGFNFNNLPAEYSYYTNTSSTTFSFNGGLRVGGGYNFSRKVGVFSDIFIGRGRPAIALGIRINSLKLN